MSGAPVFVAPVGTGDEPDWKRLRTELWPHVTEPENDADIADMRARDWCCLIARDSDGRAVGFAEAALRHDYVEGCESSPVAFLEGIYVSPEARRQGVARRLVAAVEAWARGRSAELASDALLDNVDSHRFHRAVGFEETQRVVYFRKTLG